MGIAGRPSEYFNSDDELTWRFACGEPADTDYRSFLSAILRRGTTSNGVFGAKVMWFALTHLMSLTDGSTGADLAADPDHIAGLFPNVHYVYLTRRDTVAQAVSLWRARQTGEWHRDEFSASAKPAEARYDFDQILACKQTLEADERAWEDYFERGGIEPLRLVYEDIDNGASPFIQAILDSLTQWGAAIPRELPIPPTAIRKQRDTVSDEWATRFRAESALVEPLS
jgi:LPS sulfotransferase NodH